MAENPDYKELLQLLTEFDVRYLIVGGYAIMKYAEPHYTKDLEIWIENSAENSLHLFEVLKRFGAPLESDKITPATFTQSDLTYQIGIAPVRIDILTRITNVQFPDAWEKRVSGTMFSVPVHFLSLDDLITNKQATGRSSDLEQLRKIPQKEKSDQ